MRVDHKSDARRALLLFVLWIVALVACASVAFAQETYSFPLKWTPVESTAPYIYQLGAGKTISELAAVKDIASQWTTGAVTTTEPGPWYLAVRACLTRVDAEPLCGSWRMASRTQGGSDMGPHYPASLTVPVPAEAWMTGG